ncbi:MAG: rhomboid family intramembrane serine protease [Pseudolysinimonas sp.]
MSSAAGAEVDPSVCYRHPDRTSWTLCERCGRTICPECQILTPSGVRCPDCVRELGGSVQWTPVASIAKANADRAAKAKRVRESAARAARRPRWQQAAINVLRPGTTIPVVTWTMTMLTIALWILGLFTASAAGGGLPFAVLAASTNHAVWLWTYATSAVAYPAVISPLPILLFILNIVFLLLSAPTMERILGRGRFLVVFLAGAMAGAALAVLVGGVAYGVFAGLFGLIGCYLVMVWSSPPARNQMLITLLINAVIALLFGFFFLVLGGIAGGVAAGLLLHRVDDRAGSNRAAPYLLLFGGIAVLIALAVVRGIATFGP